MPSDSISLQAGPLARPSVEALQRLLWDTLEHVLREGAQQPPGDLERVEDGSVLVRPLVDEFTLELLKKLEVQVVLGRERLLADDGLHRLDILANGVVGVQLIGDVAVVAARHALTDGGLHQTRERWQHVDWRVHLPVVQLPVDVNLTLSDVAGQIRNRVGDIVVGHSEDGKLGDRSRAALHPASALIDASQVGVHVAGVATTTGHLLARS
mmetsp:Transcript_49833/g.112073  ORF Transcript_49833/g.112073 Transcript_49833/m.112073 type:complete len:211 (-) Transcript_49833:874-1506(-)